MRPPRAGAPLLPLLPALAVVPVLLLLPATIHGGGIDLVLRFLIAAVTPSLDPVVVGSALRGLATTLAVAVMGWAVSLAFGLILGLAGSRTCWRIGSGRRWPALVVRRSLALPRSIHELLWGLLLLQVLGMEPMVAVLAIALPFGAMVARVLSDQLDALDTTRLDALRCAGVPAGPALLTALGPALLPALLSYGGYRLECALRSATLLGVFGLGGLGTELRLSLQSLEFRELWTGLWLLLAAMLALEAGVTHLRQRWLMPGRLDLDGGRPGRRSGEMLLALLALLPLTALLAWGVGANPLALLDWRPLPPAGPWDWQGILALPWFGLVGNTLLLTLLAASLAVGMAPLLLLVATPSVAALRLVRGIWALGRLWPPPLTALLLLLLLRPGLMTAALALAFHNLGILGRLLLEGLEHTRPLTEQALIAAGSGPRAALLYGRLGTVARSYLAYGAYRGDVILRESVVVGLVGASGLGSQLLESLSSFAWDQVICLVLVYACLTLTGEELSDRARHALLAPPPGPDARLRLIPRSG